MRKLLALLILAAGALAQEPAPPPDPQQLVRDGVALFDAGKLDDAIAKYRQALAIDPRNTTASYELGLTLAAKGDYAGCTAALEPIASVASPMQVQTLGMLGNCLDSSGDRKKAIKMYRKALELAPDDPRIAYELGVVSMNEKKFADARALLKKDVTARPAHVNGRYALGLAFQSDGFRIPALFEFLHLLALDPVSPRGVEAAQRVRALLDLGVERKDKKNINVTMDSNPRTEEGDYSGLSTMLAITAAARLGEDDKSKSEFEQVQGQVVSVIHMFLEATPPEQHDYTARVHRPFFEAMDKAALLEPYVATALAALQLDGTKEWAAKHEEAVNKYLDWIRPQREGQPAVLMPVPPK